MSSCLAQVSDAVLFSGHNFLNLYCRFFLLKVVELAEDDIYESVWVVPLYLMVSAFHVPDLSVMSLRPALFDELLAAAAPELHPVVVAEDEGEGTRRRPLPSSACRGRCGNASVSNSTNSRSSYPPARLNTSNRYAL